MSNEKLVPKPGLYQGGLLKSMTTWAIPFSFLQDHRFAILFLFVGVCLWRIRFAALFNTGITLTRGAVATRPDIIGCGGGK